MDAPIDIRYDRVVVRGSETDKVSVCARLTHTNSHSRSLAHSLADQVSKEKFQEDEEREWNNTDPNKQNLKAVMEMADVKLRNDVTV